MPEIDKSAKIIWDYMLMHQELKPMDAILALGSNDTRVAERAGELYAQVLKDEGRSNKPSIIWRASQSSWRKLSSGHYNPWKKRIVITAGTDGTDHKQVLLHEIAHWLTQPRGWRIRTKKRCWHGKRFYTKLNQLLNRYNCFTPEYAVRENGYMPRSAKLLKQGGDLL